MDNVCSSSLLILECLVELDNRASRLVPPDAPQLGVHFLVNIEIHTFDLATVTTLVLSY